MLHAALAALTPEAAENGSTNGIMLECGEIELKVIAIPVHTKAGLIGKRRIIRQAELDDDNGLIDAILQLDAGRVGAARI